MIPESVVNMPAAYHNGATKAGKYAAKPPIEQREVIAWDMEGMNLSGDDKPQHPVLFGCSAETDKALENQRLSSLEMLNYIIEVGERYPTALHVGYAFKYDVNMMLQDLPDVCIRILWRRNHVKVRSMENGKQWYYTIQYIPGKKFTVTRSDTPKSSKQTRRANRTTVTIYDYSSFFGGSKFVTAAEQILRNDLSATDREIIEHGKRERGSNIWADMPSVRFYWECEIRLIARTFTKFRDVMFRAGFALREWYGPGAIANYLNATKSIHRHIKGAQTSSGAMPADVHIASKHAFSGGRFEAFQLGRVSGPIHAIDINSAYPFALTMIPSLDPEHGSWRHETNPTHIRRFGFYRIEFALPGGSMPEYRPMPLFFRDKYGLISYPNKTHNWYASPETRMVVGMPGVRIVEGWYWDSDESIFPWEFLKDMYATRQRLGKADLLSLPFKLGPNSLYGKYAQTVGWNEKERTPPRSHALPVAAWITSMCRSLLWDVIRRAPQQIIAVETDSVYTTADPATLGIRLGNGLGEWSHDVYDEIAYLQSGMYLTKQNGDWSGVRSRGIGRAEFPVGDTITYLQSLKPGTEWQPLNVQTKPRFIGMGRALAGHNFRNSFCTWQSETKQITFGDAGKRRHHQPFCRACDNGSTPWDEPHRTFVYSHSDGATLSAPRRLPWEAKQTDTVARMKELDRIESE